MKNEYNEREKTLNKSIHFLGNKYNKIFFYQILSTILFYISIISLIILYCINITVKQSLAYSLVSLIVFALPLLSFFGGLLLNHVKLL
jgi:hypothetical protein